MKTLTRAELSHHFQAEFLHDEDPDLYERSRHTINRWLERGDGVAVYQNEDLGHPELGKRQFVSFGSRNAQLEYQHCTCGVCGKKLAFHESEGLIHHDDPDYDPYEGEVNTYDHDPDITPPTRLPDIGGQINWRYQLQGIYRGALL